MPNCAVSVIPSNPTYPIPSEKRILRLPSTGNFQVCVSQHETTERNEYRRDRCSAVWLGICLLKAGTRRHSTCEWPAWIGPGSERTSLHLLAAFGGAVSRRVGFRIRGRWGLKAGTGAMPQRAKMTTAVDRLSAGDGTADWLERIGALHCTEPDSAACSSV
jgi:hypothetical protein